jgi:hypothetical protein
MVGALGKLTGGLVGRSRFWNSGTVANCGGTVCGGNSDAADFVVASGVEESVGDVNGVGNGSAAALLF